MSKFSLPGLSDANQSKEKIDTEALEAFASGAKERKASLDDIKPWLKYDKNELPKFNVTVRMNDYYIEILRHLSKQQEISQHKVLAKILYPELEKIVNGEE